jgi:hypothetical protein
MRKYMPIMINFNFLLILVIISAFCSISAKASSDLIKAEAIIERVVEKKWYLDVGSEQVGHGNYLMDIRITSPREHLRKQRLMIVDKAEMEVNGRSLKEGDVFAFAAPLAFFQNKIACSPCIVGFRGEML